MSVLIFGATSRIAQALAAEYAAAGETLYLAARDADEAERIAADLRVRHSATAMAAAFDARDFDSHPALIAAAAEAMGKPSTFKLPLARSLSPASSPWKPRLAATVSLPDIMP